ncbi:MAG: hypothetical protein E6I61_10985 [Chloroflexi bacterium]|nr:MAG: hypothetical protein E6J08_11995 [Chloroflexota bacterium]TME02705.1 MAG: hypothetical protein E6I71_12545 [Chloroflexota bacterium]TME39689.1 MAG: hypothetical protein E6I61_10985 [Chloroflexota bacterium]TME53739.1 MAG: hypothetical protein E6I53_02265 [Chloroflexota bacterium]
MAEPKHREWIDRQLIADLKGPVKRGDSELRWLLVALLLVDLAAAVVVSLVGHGGLWVMIGLWAAVVALGIATTIRVMRYGAGFLWFLITLGIFLGCDWIALALMIWSGVAVSHPQLSWIATQVLGALPLFITIAVLTRKLRQPLAN